MLTPLGVAFKDREVSMSISLLYHAFGIRGSESTRTESQDGQVIFTILLSGEARFRRMNLEEESGIPLVLLLIALLPDFLLGLK